MVEIQDTLVSLDVFREQFCCDLGRCKGQCCVEGDAGAPVDEEEIADLEEAAELLSDELTPEARQVIDDEGVVGIDRDGTFVTSVVNGRDCVFAVRGDDGTTLCAIDRAHREGRTAIEKPLSCALYPIRVTELSNGTLALNYHRWEICAPARLLGRKLHTRVYSYLREPLIRAFGQSWYDELDTTVHELERQHILDEH